MTKLQGADAASEASAMCSAVGLEKEGERLGLWLMVEGDCKLPLRI